MSHTPGPWEYEEPGWDGLPHLKGANGKVVATFFSEPANPSDTDLLSAAPELLDELHEMLDYARDAYAWYGGDDEKRGRAPRIKADLDRVEALLNRLCNSPEIPDICP